MPFKNPEDRKLWLQNRKQKPVSPEPVNPEPAIVKPKQEQMKAPPADNIEMTQEDYNEFIKWKAESKKKQDQPPQTMNWMSLLTMLVPPLIGVLTRAGQKTLTSETQSETQSKELEEPSTGLQLAFS